MRLCSLQGFDTISSFSYKIAPLEPWAIITVADYQSFASHGLIISQNVRRIPKTTYSGNKL